MGMEERLSIMTKEKFRMFADVCSHVDEENSKLNLEVCIPGVKKDRIKLRMHEGGFDLSAPGETVEYAGAYAFCCPVKPDEAKASYEDGLLKIQVPFKTPMEYEVNVPVH
jgi:HSP20 family protein